MNVCVCSICLEFLQEPHCCVPCGHLYCYQCIREWKNGHGNRCPECRRIIEAIQTVFIDIRLIKEFIDDNNRLKNEVELLGRRNTQQSIDHLNDWYISDNDEELDIRMLQQISSLQDLNEAFLADIDDKTEKITRLENELQTTEATYQMLLSEAGRNSPEHSNTCLSIITICGILISLLVGIIITLNFVSNQPECTGNVKMQNNLQNKIDVRHEDFFPTFVLCLVLESYTMIMIYLLASNKQFIIYMVMRAIIFTIIYQMIPVLAWLTNTLNRIIHAVAQ